MAVIGTRQPVAALTFPPPRGVWGQRLMLSYHRPQGWPGWIRPGTGIIQGYIEIGNAGATNCRALLLSEATGVLLDDTAITDGAYLFRFLAPGNYAVVVVDNTGLMRAKAIHTVVPAP